MKKPTVLIIEDDESIRELYADALAGADLEVYKAEDGEIGVELALKHHPDMILVDIKLPGINGHVAVQQIRKDEWGKDANVIYLTNFSDPENIINAVKLNPDEYIVKANTSVKEVVNKVRAGMYT